MSKQCRPRSNCSSLIWDYTVCNSVTFLTPPLAVQWLHSKFRIIDGKEFRELDTLSRFSTVCFTRETTFVTSCLLSCTPSHLWKGPFLKGKELLPRGNTGSLLFAYTGKIYLAYVSYAQNKLSWSLFVHRLSVRVTQPFFCGDWSWNICYHLSLPLIQEGQLSVSGGRLCTSTGSVLREPVQEKCGWIKWLHSTWP